MPAFLISSSEDVFMNLHSENKKKLGICKTSLYESAINKPTEGKKTRQVTFLSIVKLNRSFSVKRWPGPNKDNKRRFKSANLFIFKLLAK